jgi:hypothetical protein
MAPYESRKINLSNWYNVPFMPGRVTLARIKDILVLLCSEKAAKFEKNPTWFWHLLSNVKNKWEIFFQILWLSQNILVLPLFIDNWPDQSGNEKNAPLPRMLVSRFLSSYKLNISTCQFEWSKNKLMRADIFFFVGAFGEFNSGSLLT